jgi:transposase
MRVAEAIEPDAKTTSELRTLSKGRRVEARVQQRASVILLAAQGWQNKDIADEVKLDRRQVALWRRRFLEGGIEALLQDASRAGRTPSMTSALEAHVVRTTLYETPPEATQWSTRTLAQHLGLSATTIRRVWQRNGLQPHLQRAPQVPRGAFHFEGHRVDVVGLYMNPQAQALVLGCGEDEAAAQALSRGRGPEQRRKDMATLLATLNALEGALASARADRHPHEAWLQFLRWIDRRAPAHQQLHLIVGHQASQRHPEVQAWLARHPRLILHPSPANASWLNGVRRFFRALAEQRIRRDSFASVGELQLAVAQHLETRPRNPRPFLWTTPL